MAFKLWCEEISADDCIKPGEWNKMTEYIKHSAVTDFTIYSTEVDCTDTGQAFLFSQAGIESLMYGGADSGDILTIFANSAEPCPSISLIGSQGIINKVAYDDQFEIATCSDETLLMVSAGGFSYKGVVVCVEPCGTCPTSGDLPFVLFNNCTTQDEKGFQFSISGSVSTMQGSDDANDDFWIVCNSADGCPSITMSGNLSMHCNISDIGIFEVSTCSDEQLFTVDVTTTDNHINFHCLDAHEFCLEARTTDPASPTCLGRLWLRTDLV